MASTVLPNGIIIPEKYSRDWYNDLYHNWQELDNLLAASPGNGTLTIQKNGTTVGTFSANQATDETINISVPTKTSDLANDSGFITSDNTKIPLSGSNQISGDLIPSTDNSIDIGSSTNNIKMLYTKGITINGTQFLPSNYMTLDTVQTVTSAKNYSGYQNINAYRLCIKSPDQKKGVIPASNQWNGFSFNDKNDERMFSIEQGIRVDGSVVLNFSGRANDNDTTFTTFLRYINNPDLTTNFVNVIDLMPFGNGTRKLGDTNAKWKSFNGINPGALSLPSSTVSMNLIGDVSVVGTEKKLSKDITVTGYIYADVSFTSSNRLNLYNDTKKYGICMPCDSGRIRQIMPISAGDRLEFNVLDNGSTVNVIQLFACQGNV